MNRLEEDSFRGICLWLVSSLVLKNAPIGNSMTKPARVIRVFLRGLVEIPKSMPDCQGRIPTATRDFLLTDSPYFKKVG